MQIVLALAEQCALIIFVCNIVYSSSYVFWDEIREHSELVVCALVTTLLDDVVMGVHIQPPAWYVSPVVHDRSYQMCISLVQ